MNKWKPCIDSWFVRSIDCLIFRDDMLKPNQKKIKQSSTKKSTHLFLNDSRLDKMVKLPYYYLMYEYNQYNLYLYYIGKLATISFS